MLQNKMFQNLPKTSGFGNDLIILKGKSFAYSRIYRTVTVPGSVANVGDVHTLYRCQKPYDLKCCKIFQKPEVLVTI